MVDPAERTIESLVEEIKKGEIRIPEMQRKYVWNSDKVCHLFDSLYRRYPTGTILMWKPKRDEKVKLRDSAISQESREEFDLLLDGQQRLTSLVALFCNEKVKTGDKEHSIDILFNLEHPNCDKPTSDSSDLEEDEQNLDESMTDANESDKQKEINKKIFAVYSKKLERQPNWISVSEIFECGDVYEILKRKNIDIGTDQGKKYRKRLGDVLEIKNYRYRIDIVDSKKSYREASDIFVRVNSGGTNLKGHDLALAQITAKWQGSLEVFQKTENRYKSQNYNLGMSALLKNLMATTTGRVGFKGLSEIKTLEKLKEGWKDADNAMEHAVKFLRNNVEIENSVLIVSPFIAVTIAYHGYKSEFKINPDEEKKLRYWALTANMKGRYSRGSSQTLLDQDIRAIGESDSGSKAERLLINLEKQMGHLDTKTTDLSGLGVQSAYFKTMFLAFQDAGAGDWFSSVNMNIDAFVDRREKKTQFHHIFPQSRLKEIGCNSKKIHDIRNLTFLSAKTNNELSDTLPEEYFKRVDKKHLTAHCIPQTKTLWKLKLEEYENFLEARGKLIAERINKFIGPNPSKKN